MKGRRAKKGAVLATAVVFMTIIIALSVLVVVFASSSTKRAVNAAKRANSSIEMNLIADEFVTSVKKEYESYKSGSDEAGIRELPVATIDAHMNEFAHKINENYRCEVSVSASKTYSLKLIETSGEKKTQIMIVSVEIKEVKDENETDKVIGYTYSVVKWNLSDSDIAKLNVGGSFSPEHMAALADDYLKFYFMIKNSELGFSADVYQLHIAELLQLDDTGLPQCYLTAETIEETDEEGNKTEIECYAAVATDAESKEEYVLFKYRLVETGENEMPDLHIYVGEDEYVFSSKSYIDGASIEHINEDKTVKTTTTTYTQIYAVIITKSSDEQDVKKFSTEGTTSTAVSSETIKIETTKTSDKDKQEGAS